MQHKTVIKVASAVVLTSVVVAALARAQTFRSQERRSSQPSDLSYNPMPPEAVKAMDAQNKRVGDAMRQARQFLKARHFAEAKQACARAISLSPKINGQPFGIQPVFQLLGDINREQGHYRDAISAYLKVKVHRPNELYMSSDEQQLDLNLALCYLKMGDITKARQFYNENTFFKGGVGASPAEKAQYMAQLPGTKTAKAMEASIYYARGCDKSIYADLEGASADFKKMLALFPRNALAASRLAENFDFFGSLDGTPYWARAAVFGKGKVAREAHDALHNRLMPDKIEPALAEARKIKG